MATSKAESSHLASSMSSKYFRMTSPLQNLSQAKAKQAESALHKHLGTKINFLKHGNSHKVSSSHLPPANFAELKAAATVYGVPEFSPPELTFEITDRIRKKVEQIKNEMVIHFPEISRSSNYAPKKFEHAFGHRAALRQLEDWLKEKLKHPPCNYEQSLEYKHMIMGIGMKELIRLINRRCLEEGQMAEDIWELTWSICRQIIIHLSRRAKECEDILEKEIRLLQAHYDQELLRLAGENQHLQNEIAKLEEIHRHSDKELKSQSRRCSQLQDQNKHIHFENYNIHEQFKNVLQENLGLFLQVAGKGKLDWARKMYKQIRSSSFGCKQIVVAKVAEVSGDKEKLINIKQVDQIDEAHTHHNDFIKENKDSIISQVTDSGRRPLVNKSDQGEKITTQINRQENQQKTAIKVRNQSKTKSGNEPQRLANEQENITRNTNKGLPAQIVMDSSLDSEYSQDKLSHLIRELKQECIGVSIQVQTEAIQTETINMLPLQSNQGEVPAILVTSLDSSASKKSIIQTISLDKRSYDNKSQQSAVDDLSQRQIVSHCQKDNSNPCIQLSRKHLDSVLQTTVLTCSKQEELLSKNQQNTLQEGNIAGAEISRLRSDQAHQTTDLQQKVIHVYLCSVCQQGSASSKQLGRSTQTEQKKITDQVIGSDVHQVLGELRSYCLQVTDCITIPNSLQTASQECKPYQQMMSAPQTTLCQGRKQPQKQASKSKLNEAANTLGQTSDQDKPINKRLFKKKAMGRKKQNSKEQKSNSQSRKQSAKHEDKDRNSNIVERLLDENTPDIDYSQQEQTSQSQGKDRYQRRKSKEMQSIVPKKMNKTVKEFASEADTDKCCQEEQNPVLMTKPLQSMFDKKSSYELLGQICEQNSELINNIRYTSDQGSGTLDQYFELVQQVNSNSVKQTLLSEKLICSTIQRNLFPILNELVLTVRKACRQNRIQSAMKNFVSLPEIIFGRMCRKYGVKNLASKKMKMLLTALKQAQRFTQKYKMIELMIFTNFRTFSSEDLFIYLAIIGLFNHNFQSGKTITEEEADAIKKICQENLTMDSSVYEQFHKLKREAVDTNSEHTTLSLLPIINSVVLGYRQLKMTRIQELGFVFHMLKQEQYLEYNKFIMFLSGFELERGRRLQISKKLLEYCDMRTRDKSFGISEGMFFTFLVNCPQLIFEDLRRQVQKTKNLIDNQSSKKDINLNEPGRREGKSQNTSDNQKESPKAAISKESDLLTSQLCQYFKSEEANKRLNPTQRQFIKNYLVMHLQQCEVDKIVGIVDYFSTAMLELASLPASKFKIVGITDSQ